MAIRRDEVRRIAELARLEIREEDLGRIAGELSAVLDYAQALKRLDLAGCEPPGSVAAPGAPLRADEPDGRSLSQEQALAMAPETEGGLFIVPLVIEGQEP